MSTTMATILGALIALGGVLLTIIGTTLSGFLQRRHERRLKLEDVRRETYAGMLAVLRESSAHFAEMMAARDELDRIKAEAERTGVEHTDVRRLERSKNAVERNAELKRKRGELQSAVELLGGLEVQRELAAAVKKLAAQRELKSDDLDAFVNACRRELGVKGEAV